MKKTQCEKLARALLAHFPSYAYVQTANAICEIPVNNVFRGISFESSGFSGTAFYPGVFSQPLYVPASHLSLTFGKRVMGNWEYEPGKEQLISISLREAMESESAVRLLEDLSSAENLAANLLKYHSNQNDPYLQQAIAYSYAVCGNYAEALTRLDRCEATLREMQIRDPNIKWHQVLLDEVSNFGSLVASDPNGAMKQLQEWTEYTRRNLGLPD